jgi:hypothetical protein
MVEQVHGIGFATGCSLDSPFCWEGAFIALEIKLAKNEFE